MVGWHTMAPVTCLDMIIWRSLKQRYVLNMAVMFTDCCKHVHDESSPKQYRVHVIGMHKPINNVKGPTRSKSQRWSIVFD